LTEVSWRGKHMSIKLNIDLKELYEKLSPECRKQLLQYVKEKLDEAMIEQMILGQSNADAKKKGGK